MAWVMMAIFVSNSIFYFRVLEVHSTELGCLMAAEASRLEMQTNKNFVFTCIPTDQIGAHSS